MSLYNKIIDRQKLDAAWQKVRKNKPAAGVDRVTWEQYDEEIKENIRLLNKDLTEHTYAALPVKEVMLYKGDKARTIALYAMRDKVVQQSLAAELTKIFDKDFSARTYAYRPGKSALSAIEDIHERIVSEKYRFFIKLDIHDFFWFHPMAAA